MFGLVVRFALRPGAAEGFDRLVAETLPQIVALEPGTQVYATHAVEEDPDARIFYELYRSREAFDEHERQEHVMRFLAAREEFLAAPPRVEFLSLIDDKGVTGGAK
ncbi:antibiotic biosynthesis monooxygenase [Pseudofrankia sp. BMG5.36]|uniref:putative quinol monooxygenase n=1 Tax=Pseudofrankia sp. BMG5.36 TaxID=1834512 RepID=UPI0008D98D78|nr:antibiotic biosynthesis monooxygenase [Pseudofrankia sp. BMG5.36]OHV44908.1 antibiotic biosynthesis monooxygenase [Pseudofrankia sp. BMG5.36]